MAGIPKLPGLTNFTDASQNKFNVCQTFHIVNGYKLPKSNYYGPGGRELAVNSVKCFKRPDVVTFDPSLYYGRTKTENSTPQFLPHYVLYSQKCLSFRAFFRQGIFDSPNEFYRIRQVNIIYFLEDDTITVIEPKTENSGISQGRLVRRGKIAKHETGQYWHWKDFNIGKDIVIYGIVYHIVDCDKFTKEYMASQGITMTDTETMPPDPYTINRQLTVRSVFTKTKASDDKLRRFLEYDGKVLKFKAVWDDGVSALNTLMRYEILYFLSDDTVVVKEVHEKNDGRDPYSVLLRKTKLPKRYTDTPSTYAAVCLELSDAEITEYYQPKDFQIGETIFVLGRDMLLYDCDNFTRLYFQKALGIEQKPAITISVPPKKRPVRVTPPHDGFGSLEDSLQNTITFLPKPPRKDIMKQLLNANKYLRYEMIMDTVHPEDLIRKFVMSYSLADGKCTIREPPIKNSGILGGKYLQATLLIKPGSDPLNPDYYSPVDFFIGAGISVFNRRFTITGADLYTYRYMESNADKFPCEVIENTRNYMFNKGYLKEDIYDQLTPDVKFDKQDDIDSTKAKSDLEECYQKLKVAGDSNLEEEQRVKDEVRQQYEESIVHKSSVVPYGIKPINQECPYPVEIGDVKDSECKDDDQVAQYTSYTPKHIETSKEKAKKFYMSLLKSQKDVCDDKNQIECVDPPPRESQEEGEVDRSNNIIVSEADRSFQQCKSKTVRFADENGDRCTKDKTDDLCKLNRNIIHDNCTNYQREGVDLSQAK